MDSSKLQDRTRYWRLTPDSASLSQLNSFRQYILPSMAANQLQAAYTVTFPEGLPHTLTELKQGGYGTMIRGSDGKFAGTASLYPLEASAAVLQAFTGLSVITGQYFLARISKSLDKMNLKLDEVLKFLYGDKKAELLSEWNFVHHAYDSYASIMQHEAQRIATISSLQESMKIAVKDIEFYIYDLGNLASQMDQVMLKPQGVSGQASKALNVWNSLQLSQQVYAISTVMEVFFSQNYDKNYLSCVEEELHTLIEKSNRRVLEYFAAIRARAQSNPIKALHHTDNDEFKTIDQIINSLNSGEETPLMLEVRRIFHEAISPVTYYIDADGDLYTDKH